MAAVTGIFHSINTVPFDGTADAVGNFGLDTSSNTSYTPTDYLGADLKVIPQGVITTGDGYLDVTLYYYEVDLPTT